MGRWRCRPCVSQGMSVKKNTTESTDRTMGKNGSNGSGTPRRWLMTTCQNVPFTRATAPTMAAIASEKIVPFERRMMPRTPRYSASSRQMLTPRVCSRRRRPVAVSVDQRYRITILAVMMMNAFR